MNVLIVDLNMFHLLMKYYIGSNMQKCLIMHKRHIWHW